MNARLSSFRLAAIVILLLSNFLTGARAFAGGNFNGGGGGVGYVCGRGIYLADTYSLLHQGPDGPALIARFKSWSTGALVYELIDSLSIYLVQPDWPSDRELKQIYRSLQFKEVASVPPTQDSGITTVPCGGSLIQLARQDDKGVVELAPEVRNLPVLEQAFLHLHEVQLRWLIKTGRFGGTTTSVRSWVSAFVPQALRSMQQPVGTMMVTQEIDESPVCFRGKFYHRIRPDRGWREKFAIYEGKEVVLPDDELTPGVPGEVCPPPPEHPGTGPMKQYDKPDAPFLPSFRLSEADRKRISAVDVRWSLDNYPLLKNVRVGTCDLSTPGKARYFREDGNRAFLASVASTCFFDDPQIGKRVTLKAGQEIELLIRETQQRSLALQPYEYYRVDEPIIISKGAFDPNGLRLDFGRPQDVDLTLHSDGPVQIEGREIGSGLTGALRGRVRWGGTADLFKATDVTAFLPEDDGRLYCAKSIDQTTLCFPSAEGITIFRPKNSWITSHNDLFVFVSRWTQYDERMKLEKERPMFVVDSESLRVFAPQELVEQCRIGKMNAWRVLSGLWSTTAGGNRYLDVCDQRERESPEMRDYREIFGKTPKEFTQLKPLRLPRPFEYVTPRIVIPMKIPGNGTFDGKVAESKARMAVRVRFHWVKEWKFCLPQYHWEKTKQKGSVDLVLDPTTCPFSETWKPEREWEMSEPVLSFYVEDENGGRLKARQSEVSCAWDSVRLPRYEHVSPYYGHCARLSEIKDGQWPKSGDGSPIVLDFAD